MADHLGGGHGTDLLRGLGVALIAADLDGTITFANPAAGQLLRRPSAELIGRRLHELVAPSRTHSVEAELERRRRGEIGDYASTALLPDGTSLPVRVSAAPLLDGEGRAVGGVALIAARAAESAATRPWFLDELADVLGEAVIVTDGTGTVQLWNAAAERIYGWSSAEARGRPIHEVVRPVEGHAPDYDHVMDAVLAGDRWSGEMQVRRPDGVVVTVLVTDTPLRHPSGELLGIIGVSLDVTARRRAERDAARRATQHAAVARFGHWVLSGRRTVTELLSGAGSLCAELFDVGVVQVWLLDGDRRLVLRGGAGCTADVDRAVRPPGGVLDEALHADTALVVADQVEERCRDAGEPPLSPGVRSLAAAPLHGPDGPLGVVCACSDRAGHFDGIDTDVLRSAANALAAAIVDVRHRVDIERRALTDPLTGLPNRILFNDRLRLALRRVERTRRRVGVLYLDVDRFKQVNDAWGHQVGDELLVGVAERIATVLRPSDTVARLGGDEFGVLCEDLDDPADVVTLAERISEAVGGRPLDTGLRIRVTVSVGAAVGEPGAGSAADLLTGADTAMYRAKAQGPGYVEVLEPGALTARHARLELVHQLAGALERDELRVVYLPMLGLSSPVVGVEALLRWDHPERGELAPLEFLDAAVDGGLMPRLGELVVTTVRRDVDEWRAGGRLPDHVAVNLSTAELLDGGTVELVEGIWAGDDGPVLWIEVAEGAVFADRRRVPLLLERLAAAGVRLAVDDYGTGGSSLADLAELPVHAVKLDPALVSGGAGPGLAAPVVLGAVVQASHALGVATVAEGVETAEQLAGVAALGCGFAQGRHLAVPLAATDVPDWVGRRRG